MRISDWSSDVCSSDLVGDEHRHVAGVGDEEGPVVDLDRVVGDAEQHGKDQRHAALGEETAPARLQRRADLGREILESGSGRGGIGGGKAHRWFLKRRNGRAPRRPPAGMNRSEEHTSELQSLMRISYAVFCLKKKKTKYHYTRT